MSYGITDAWDISIKIGLADLKGQSRDEDGRSGHNFDNDYAWGWSTRYTFLQHDKIDWGLSLQMNWVDTDWSTSSAEVDGDFAQTARHDVRVKYYDILIAAGPTIDRGGWSVFGGPFYHYLSGDLREIRSESITFLGDTLTRRESAKGDFKASGFGGFIGVQFDILQNSSLSSTFSATDYGWSVGGNITFKF